MRPTEIGTADIADTTIEPLRDLEDSLILDVVDVVETRCVE